MILLIGIFFILFVILAFWRRIHQVYVLKKFRFKMFSLRDRLRMLVIEGDLDSKSWEFTFFENLFSRTIHDSYYITLFRMIVLSFRDKEHGERREFNKKIIAVLKNNPKLTLVINDFYSVLIDYATGQHWLSFNLFIKPIFSVLIGASILQGKLKSVIERTIIFRDDSPNLIYS